MNTSAPIYLGKINSQKKILPFYFLIVLCCSPIFSQTTFQFNALADLEFSKAGEQSHFYYNEIDKDHVGARIGLSQLNLIGKIKFNKQWSFKTRLLLERDKGVKFDNFQLPLLNVQWVEKKRKYGLTVGRFINPFGSFNQKQLSINRNFIGLPLAYSYYVNISDKIGLVENMGEVLKVPVDGVVQWGSANLYYGGYTTGAMFSWNVKPTKINWKIALVNGASNLQEQMTEPLHVGIISKLKLQAAYFWEQGISVSHGTFIQESELSGQLGDLRSYSQTMVGTDFKLGTGFFEISGEIIGAFYEVPVFNPDLNTFENASQKINNLAAYLDVKYELPILQGSFLAYRIDHLHFNKLDAYSGQPWDNDVLRHSFAIGYNINQYALIRAAVSSQQVDTKNWGKTQRTLRVVLTAHY